MTYFNEKGYYEVSYGYHGPALKKTNEFFEFSKINLSDYQIEVPANYRDILKQLYGKNWEVPDPGFKHDEDTRQWDKKYHLDLKQVSALYWKQFYNKRNIQNHSRFASFVNDFISSKSNIVEIGCGSVKMLYFLKVTVMLFLHAINVTKPSAKLIRCLVLNLQPLTQAIAIN